jgi:hypothetical protein
MSVLTATINEFALSDALVTDLKDYHYSQVAPNLSAKFYAITWVARWIDASPADRLSITLEELLTEEDAPEVDQFTLALWLHETGKFPLTSTHEWLHAGSEFEIRLHVRQYRNQQAIEQVGA